MRPLWLRMTAFGPFAGVEEVDFRPAVAAGLFGIYGPTGSGKSSIFNAMTFALFGEAAREEHDVKALRSDHAAADLATGVEFLFDLAGKRHLVRRAPEQMRPKQRGEGFTRAAHEAHLFDATGLSVEEIAAGAVGKIIEEKKVGRVNEALRALLGYGPGEFRRIVLLPQGRFEAFLSAKTDARKEILKELFDVRIYGRLAAKLKAEAAEARKAYEKARLAHDARLQAEGFEDPPALDAGIEAAAEAAQKARGTEAQAAETRETAAQSLAAARAVEALFLASETAARDLAAQREGEAQTAAMQADLARLEKAAGLVDPARRKDEAEAEMRRLAARLAEAGQALKRAEADAEAARAALAREEARAEEAAALTRRRDVLDAHAAATASAEGLREAARAAAQAARDAAARQKGEENAQEARRGRLRDGAAALKTAREAEATRQALDGAVRLLTEETRAAKAHETAATALAQAEADRAAAEKDHAAAQAESAQAEAARAEAEAALAEVQALHLAAALTPGAPCPVCGSAVHPAPAAGEVAGHGADAAFRAAREIEAKAAKKLAQAAARLSAAAALAQERAARLADLAAPPRPRAEAEAELKARRGALAALPAPADIAALDAAQERLAQEIDAAETMLAERRAACAAAQAEAAQAGARLDAALAAVPEALRDPAALAAARQAVEQELAARAQALAAAQTAAQGAGETRAAAQATLAAAQQAAGPQAERAEQAGRLFAESCLAAGLTEAEWRDLAPRLPGVPALREAIAARREALAAARVAAEKAAAAVEALERPDMAAAETADAEAENARRAAAEARLTAEALETRLRALREALAEMRAATAAQDAATAPLRDLAALCDGENPQRLDLETFALGAMFDRALAAANARLGPMSGGRYSMRRQTEGEGGRARRGLGIEVFDLHTGQARSTTSLSGGEGFIHALALALGLADVVERSGGRVRLDTIFIDEGFGSLDADETLGEVLDALAAVTGGVRAVGLISHVPQVQEAAPVGFSLRKTAAGSTIEPRGPAG